MARVTHRNDRMHRGLVPTDQLGTGSATATTVLLGNQTWGSAPGASFGSNATEVGNASAGGSSSSNSRADHVHKGVHSLTAAGSNALYGDVNVAAGSGIAVTQSGQTVTITNTGTSSGGGSGTLTTIEEVDGNPTSSAVTKLVLPNGTLSYVGTVATYTPAASAGGTTFPTIVQAKTAGTAATSLTLDATPVSGHSLVLVSNATTGQISSVASTNTTWTQVKTLTSAGGSFYSIWVGVCAASAGTSVTWSKAGSFASVIVIELTDALTPTLGQSATTSGVSISGIAAIAATTAGHLIVAAGGADNTTLAQDITLALPCVGFATGVMTLLAGYSTGNRAYGVPGGNAGGLMLAEIT
jgi:hypothetical protein